MLDLTPIFAAFPILETDRLQLRAVSADDTADILHLFSSFEVMRYIGRTPLTTPEQAAQRVAAYQMVFKEQTGIAWGITLREDSRLIGTFVLWNMDAAHHRAEIGYLLTPEWWGQGIVSEAARAVLAFSFTIAGLHSLEAQTAPDNAASRRVLDKLGFVQEGYFRENFYDPTTATFGDTVVYSLLKSAWATP